MIHRPGHSTRCRETPGCETYSKGYERGRRAAIAESTAYKEGRADAAAAVAQPVLDEIRHLRTYVEWLEQDRAKIETHRQKLLGA